MHNSALKHYRCITGEAFRAYKQYENDVKIIQESRFIYHRLWVSKTRPNTLINFILNQNSRFIIISLILAGIAYWIRINGVWVFIVISLIYFLTYKKSWKFIANYGIAIAIFLIMISPILIERNEAFDDPFYSM